MTTNKLRIALLLVSAGTVVLAQPPAADNQQGPPPQQSQQQAGPGGPGQGGPGGPGMMQGPGRGMGQGMQGPGRGMGQGPGMGQAGRGGRGQQGPPPGMEQALLPGPHGKWWDDPEMAQRLSLTADQKKKMDDVFQQSRLKLIDLHAGVQKEEAIMEPLVAADQPDEAKIVAQIDKVAQARAELEKANARMLLAVRRVLTPEQFQKLQPARPANGQQPPPPPRKKQ